MNPESRACYDTLLNNMGRFHDVISQHQQELGVQEVGRISSIHRGIVRIKGLSEVTNEELLRLSKDHFGWVFNLDREEVGCVLLDHGKSLKVGAEVTRTYRSLDVPVGDDLVGRVIDPLGRPLDDGVAIESSKRFPVERPATAIVDRDPVRQPLQTGIKVVDALVPIGHGQRQLVLGDRQTGKTSIALDTIMNQKDSGVICIYCSIGQRNSAVANVIQQLKSSGALRHSIVVVGESKATAGMQFIAPFAAMSIGEYFMKQGKQVLVVFDEMIAHAKAFREMSLLMRRTPGREAYPGDVFYVHARLLERATCLKSELGGGSLTALPIVETEAENLTAYIPTNLISITDGQIYLSRDRFQKNFLPAVDVGRSVSRVGGKAQLKAYHRVVGKLRLTYSQFEELEKFAKFSSQLDESTRRKLIRGLRVREVLKQPKQDGRDAVEQLTSFVCVTHGLFDRLRLSDVSHFEMEFAKTVLSKLPELCVDIRKGEDITGDDIKSIIDNCSQHPGYLERAHANA